MDPAASKVGRRGTIVLPAKLRLRLGIEEGSFHCRRRIVENGKLIIQPAADEDRVLVNTWESPSHADASVNVKFAAMPDAASTQAGLIFSATGHWNLYELTIAGNGNYSVQKLIDKNWSMVVDWTKDNAIKTGVGQLNLLRVVISGEKTSCYMNGVEVVSNLALAPPGKHFGLDGQSPKAAIAKIEFSDLKVVQPTS